MHPNEDMPFEHILDQSDTDSRGLSAIDVCETHEQGRRPVYVPDGGLVYDVFLSMVRDHSFGRYFFSSNGVTCLRYSSHS